ncbi:MAG: ASCH domain-containing protein [Burkholderiales bacterium]
MSDIKEHPILFNAEMVRAILGGRKTQTRRIAKNIRLHVCGEREDYEIAHKGLNLWIKKSSDTIQQFCPYGKIGDLLWVRETHAIWSDGMSDGVTYKADDGNYIGKWRSSIHMPRWASRITLQITDVRVERLQGISQDDAQNEGWKPLAKDGKNPATLDPISWYRDLWDRINGAGSWDTNPFVWVIEFKRI